MWGTCFISLQSASNKLKHVGLARNRISKRQSVIRLRVCKYCLLEWSREYKREQPQIDECSLTVIEHSRVSKKFGTV